MITFFTTMGVIFSTMLTLAFIAWTFSKVDDFRNKLKSTRDVQRLEREVKALQECCNIKESRIVELEALLSVQPYR